MNITQRIIDFIKLHEGCILVPYKDDKISTPEVEYSIGYGHQIVEHEEFLMKGIDQQYAEYLLGKDLISYADTIDYVVTASITNTQKEALLSLCYNIGKGAFKNSTLLKRINSMASKDEIDKHFLEWNSHGKLIQRRQDELKYYWSDSEQQVNAVSEGC